MITKRLSLNVLLLTTKVIFLIVIIELSFRCCWNGGVATPLKDVSGVRGRSLTHTTYPKEAQASTPVRYRNRPMHGRNPHYRPFQQSDRPKTQAQTDIQTGRALKSNHHIS